MRSPDDHSPPPRRVRRRRPDELTGHDRHGPPTSPGSPVPPDPARGAAAAGAYGAAPHARPPHPADQHGFDPFDAGPGPDGGYGNDSPADRYAADPRTAGRYDADPYDADPYDADPYDADPYNGDRYGADRYGDRRYTVDGYGAPPQAPRHRDPAPGYPAPGYSAPGGTAPGGGAPGAPAWTDTDYRYDTAPHDGRRHHDRYEPGDRSGSDAYGTGGHRVVRRREQPVRQAPLPLPQRPSPRSNAEATNPRLPARDVERAARSGTAPGGYGDEASETGADPAARATTAPPPPADASPARPGETGGAPRQPADASPTGTGETGGAPPTREDTASAPGPAAGTAPADRLAGPDAAASSARTTRRGREGGTDDGGHAGHGHGHGPAARADRRVRIALAVLLVPLAVLTAVGLVLLHPFGELTRVPDDGLRMAGHVTAAAEAGCVEGDATGCLELTVAMDEGPLAGRDVPVLVSVVRGEALFGVGDDVVVLADSAAPEDVENYQVVDFQRTMPLAWLAGLFAVAVIALGRWRGLAALGGLAVTVLVLVGFVMPAILAGRDPLHVAVVGSCAAMFAALYLTHGVSARTSAAVLGTLASLLLIGGLGIAFTELASLTGANEDVSSLSNTLGTAVDARGLLLAGLIIGALGALDDVTVTQTSAVWELRAANPTMPARTLFGAAMRIGRDHLASAVNTLVLAYAGTALPLLLLFSVAERGLEDTLTAQVIATEIVRTLVGSIGLVASVPLTTALAVLVATRGTIGATTTERPVTTPA